MKTVDTSTWTDRERIARFLLRDVVVSDESIEILRLGGWLDGQPDWTEALETADAILASGFGQPPAVDSRALTESLGTAEGWAEHGYTEHGQAYWSGMRDTLRVVLGITTVAPTSSQADTAAYTILGAQQRLTRKGPR